MWLYHCFSLSLRDVELILAACGVVVPYSSIREWGLPFSRLFANTLKRRRPWPGDKWFMDEVLLLGIPPAWAGHLQAHAIQHQVDQAAACQHARLQT